MTRWAALALLSHWRRHSMQLVTLILGLALATALWTGVQAINAEARANYDRAANALAQNDLPRLVPREGDTLPLADYVALRRAGWDVAPVVEGRLRLSDTTVSLIGLDPLSAPRLPEPTGAAPPNPGEALLNFIMPPGELRGHPETLALLPAAIAARQVATEDLSPGTLVGDIGTVSRLLDLENRVSRLLLIEMPDPTRPPLAEIAPDLIQVAPAEPTDIRGLTGSFHLNLTAFGMLAFAVGLFIVHGAIGLAFEERRSTVRTLRALGAPLGQIAMILATEALAMALIAGALGVGFGYVLALALLPDVAATLRGLYGAPVAGSLAVRPEWWAAGLAMAVAGTALAAAQSLLQLSHLGILAPANPRAWAMASSRSARRMAYLGLAGLALAMAATAWGSGLIGGFMALAGLLLGSALLLPLTLTMALRLAARRADHPVAQWFWADARQQVPGLSLALMALLLALAANIGVSTMVASFRSTFEGWLDQRLAAELYVSFDTDAAAQAARPWLEAHSDAVLPIPRVEADLGGAPGLLYGMTDHATYRQAWPILSALPQVWDRLAAGDGILINEQWHYRADLSPGDTAKIDGRGWTVLGVYSDYGNPRPQAILGLGAFQSVHPEANDTRFALRVPSAEAPGIAAELLNSMGLRPDQVIDQTRLKAESRTVFERTFAATDALNVLTLAVAGFAIFTSLLTLQSVRLPQVAPLWALGLTRRRIALLDLGRAAMLAGLVAVLAVPVGLALAWLLLAVVNVEAFGWRLPMRAFPLEWLRLGGLAILAAVIAATLPARRLARLEPATLLKVFAHAR